MTISVQLAETIEDLEARIRLGISDAEGTRQRDKSLLFRAYAVRFSEAQMERRRNRKRPLAMVEHG